MILSNPQPFASFPFPLALAKQAEMWDYPTMTVTADDKKRVVVPGAKPGDVFAYEEQDNERFLLVRLNKPDPPARMSRTQVRKAIRDSALKFDLTWEELRAWTREP
jgi:hypothetical protein